MDLVGRVSGGGPFVSVIVAAFNAERTLGASLDCMLRQDYDSYEIVVVDDCSTDGTWRLIRDFAARDSRIVCARNSERLMAAAARNRCLGMSTGQYIMIQDADDLSEPHRMKELVSYLEQRDVDFVSSGYYVFDSEGTYGRVVPSVPRPEKKDLLWGAPFCHAATMFRRACLEAVGGYRVSPETRRGQDYDLFMRLYSKGHVGANVPDALYGYRVDIDTLRRRRLSHRIDECRIRLRGFTELGLMPWAVPFVAKPLVAHVVQMAGMLVPLDRRARFGARNPV